MPTSLVKRILAMIAVLMVAAACSYSPVIVKDTVSYNTAVASSTNQMLLLNIIRASKRQPTYYTRLEGNTESTGLSTTNTFTFPFSSSIASSYPPSSPGSYAGLSKTLAGAAASIGLGASDSSALNLQTLDDKKYETGMMWTLDEATVQRYWNEGFQRDLLLLLFVSSIDIKRVELEQLKVAFDRDCYSESRDLEKFCRVYRANAHLTDIAGPGCAPGTDSVTFVNDPAIDDDSPTSPAACFRELVLGLIGTGLEMEDAKAKTLVEANVKASLVDNPKIRTEILKEGLEIVPDKPDPEHVSLCKASSGGAVFVLDQGDFDSIKEMIEAAKNSLVPQGTRPKKKKPDPCTSDADSPAEGRHEDPKIASLGIDMTFRSFEGINYFLGEIVRAGTESATRGHIVVPIVSRDGRHPVEDLFVALKDESVADVATAVSDDGGNYYYIPGDRRNYAHPAEDVGDCTAENPCHESMQVLTMLNQLWGLNKEATSGPANAAVVVGGAVP